MSIFNKLFGGDNSSGIGAPVAEADYEGFHIATLAMAEGGQFRVCADISKEVGGEHKTHRLIRADLCNSKEEASDIALRKSRQVIDERGEGIFG